MTQPDEPTARFRPPKDWRLPKHSETSPNAPSRPQEPQLTYKSPTRTSSSPVPQSHATHAPVWEYQWGDNLNAFVERQVVPDLPARICEEIARTSASRDVATIFVRGELGIGKTTLRHILSHQLLQQWAMDNRSDPYIANALLTTEVIEAEDLESAVEFAKRINDVPASACLVALARPGTLDAASQWFERQATAFVTMSPFEPTRALFRPCIENICAAMNISDDVIIELIAELSGRLPYFMCTPFYFERLAELAVVSDHPSELKGMSPLQTLERSIAVRLGNNAYEELVDSALGRPGEGFTIPGLIDESGNFHHDGYRAVVLASLVLQERLTFGDLMRLRNSIAALRIVLDHVEKTYRVNADNSGLLDRLEDFVRSENDPSDIPYLIYIQGLIAASLRKVRRVRAAELVRGRCANMIAQGHLSPTAASPTEATVAWDVSDALSLVGDERLIAARNESYNVGSHYFTYVEGRELTIGSDFVPIRSDNAKPVLPYSRQTVKVGPLFVANYLVTNEQYREFWSHALRDRCFAATGAQWINDDPELMEAIETSFDIAARRNFWKEMRDQESANAAGLGGSTPILTIARIRALRQGRVMLWDPSQSDDRFSMNGCPVVGITWWEAVAFCKWWEIVKLPRANLPSGRHVRLLTDWEWEALRRLYYEPPDLPDAREYEVNRYPAHLRLAQATPNIDEGRANTIRRPLHVGLYPVPRHDGPTDLVGNVWEWTRSRVYGRIVPAADGQEEWGESAWDDVDPQAERIACGPWRDTEDAESDLTYRAVRGASFFSVDGQAAWNPAYRLCDPPYSSYFDLGFRIAVYPS